MFRLFNEGKHAEHSNWKSSQAYFEAILWKLCKLYGETQGPARILAKGTGNY